MTSSLSYSARTKVGKRSFPSGERVKKSFGEDAMMKV
nr:MAG TPA: hypothetical protein [Caudoviricetes sp.]